MSRMSVTNNIAAKNIQMNLKLAGKNEGKAMERLSSGFQINRASDDAAGLAISEKMRGQIRGMRQAGNNTEDAQNLLKTMDGGMSVIQDMMLRQRELMVYAANDTNEGQDREKIQLEIDQLTEEIGEVAKRTKFNNIPLLTIPPKDAEGGGSVGGTKKTLIGTETKLVEKTELVGKTEIVERTETVTKTENVYVENPVWGVDYFEKPVFEVPPRTYVVVGYIEVEEGDDFSIWVESFSAISPGTYWPDLNLSPPLDGYNFGYYGEGGSLPDLDLAHDFLPWGEGSSISPGDNNLFCESARYNGYNSPEEKFDFYNIKAAGDGRWEIRVQNYGGSMRSRFALETDPDHPIHYYEEAVEYFDPEPMWVEKEITEEVVIREEVTTWEEVTTTEEVTTELYEERAIGGRPKVPEPDPLWIQSGANGGQGLFIDRYDCRPEALYRGVFEQDFTVDRDGNTEAVRLSKLDVSSAKRAATSLMALDATFGRVNSFRSRAGAQYNRLEFTLSSLGVSEENLAGAESRIRDADMAREMMDLTKSQTLRQVGAAMLAQANQEPEMVLQLLG